MSRQRSDVEDRLRSADDVDPRTDSTGPEDTRVRPNPGTDQLADRDHIADTGPTTVDRSRQGTSAETVTIDDTDRGRTR